MIGNSDTTINMKNSTPTDKL